jgi:hypothetical protein
MNAVFSDWDIDLAYGLEGETFLRFLLGNEAKIEVKHDSMAHDTGNVYVETASRGKASGLSVTRADYYAFVLDDEFGAVSRIVFIPTTKLRLLILNGKRSIVKGGDNKTSRGYLVPLWELVKP